MGTWRPLYRRWRPPAQKEADYRRDFGLRWAVDRLRAQGVVGPFPIGLRWLSTQFPPLDAGTRVISGRELLGKLLRRGGVAPCVNLLPARPTQLGGDDAAREADALLPARAAAGVFAAVSPHLGVRVLPEIRWQLWGGAYWPYRVDDLTGVVSASPNTNLFSFLELLELKFYGDAAPTVQHPTFKSLAALAYGDFFPGPLADALRDGVAQAMRAAGPGWAGTIGPKTGTFKLIGKPLEGNYDMTQQHLLRSAYAYFDVLPDDARERLIRELLARGRIARVNLPDTLTSGRVPNDWSRAGMLSPLGLHKRIGETENHILMIATARYLSNQLLYQRTHAPLYDNRRNGTKDAPSCMDQVLYLLRCILRCDFSEYNAKSYQHETRTALLNLHGFAYDAEVRLGARMALDYVSARMAVSSHDARRQVPFRRRNERKNSAHHPDGWMTTSLLDWQGGADPMTEHMAAQTGALRAFGVPAEPWRPLDWSIGSNGDYTTYELLSDYRMPRLIQDLFVNDPHRRFFQVMNRFMLDDPEVTGRNTTVSELNAASPSYLLTAGGAPATFAINPRFAGIVFGSHDQQRGVAVPSSFMPTSGAAANTRASDGTAVAGSGLQSWAADLIQIGRFAQEGDTDNHGVAPDLLFGPFLHLPPWCLAAMRAEHQRGRFDFVDKKGPLGEPGFYLAILRDGDLAIVEAFDTWLHPETSFDAFRKSVWARNGALSAAGLPHFDEITYTTQAGHRVTLIMYVTEDASGAYPTNIVYDPSHPSDRLPDGPPETFLRGAVMTGTGDGLVRVSNPALGGSIELDMRDMRRPRRRAEDGTVEAAGGGEEVWVDFQFPPGPPAEGDFFRPFRTLAQAVLAVQPSGTLRIVPGVSLERGTLTRGKRLRITAPAGDVRIGGV